MRNLEGPKDGNFCKLGISAGMIQVLIGRGTWKVPELGISLGIGKPLTGRGAWGVLRAGNFFKLGISLGTGI